MNEPSAGKRCIGARSRARRLARRHVTDGKLDDDDDDGLDDDEEEEEELEDDELEDDDALTLITGPGGFGLTDMMLWSKAAGIPGEHNCL